MSPAQDGSLVESHPYVTGSGKDREHSLLDSINSTKQQHPLTVCLQPASLLCLYPGAKINSLEEADKEENNEGAKVSTNQNVTLYEYDMQSPECRGENHRKLRRHSYVQDFVHTYRRQWKVSVTELCSIIILSHGVKEEHHDFF